MVVRTTLIIFYTGCAIKIWSHIFSPMSYNLNFSAVFGLVADKVHPYKFFKVKIKSKSRFPQSLKCLKTSILSSKCHTLLTLLLQRLAIPKPVEVDKS